ncbi:unnamed protein product [Durusdinium trenchii]|uniref:Major facilitator superfamily (MFS) profile domain-containing protein n=1 Tax=Durusdinium trenchii TaxID=1381693 RepID=A0ABP0T0C8_9DINO
MAAEIREGSPEETAGSTDPKQMRATIIAAISNLSTAYNLVNVNLTNEIMENEFCNGAHCNASIAATSTACLAGAIFGQLTFGYVGDWLGRGPALYLTMVMSTTGALVSAFAVPLNPRDPTSVFIFLSIARFILGIGVGGVYPLAATVAAEGSSSSNRGRSVALVFSMQGVGQLLVPVVGMICLYTFGDGMEHEKTKTVMNVKGLSWRLILGLGALPGILLMPFQRADSQAARPDTSQAPSMLQALSNRAYWRSILGCAGGWFLFDITFYGNSLFAPAILQDVFHVDTGSSTPVIGSKLQNNLCWQLAILALLGLPGYYVSVCFMDRLGRKNIQIQGFGMMAMLYTILAAFLDGMEDLPALLLFVYGLTYFFSNFGPNSTTFILPSESFPQHVRSSLNGFCAAMGKTGAVVGSSMFKPLITAAGTSFVFICCAVCALLGIIVTIFCVDDRRGQDMMGESEESLSQSREDPFIEASDCSR